MFGIGTWEWVLIIIIALVFLGPDKLPEVARSAGKGMRAVRKALRGLEEEVGPLARSMGELDPRRVFDDAVRQQTEAASGPAPEAQPELEPADLVRGAHGAQEDAPGPPAPPPPAPPPPAHPPEADGRVAAGPPLARPRPTPSAAPTPDDTDQTDQTHEAGEAGEAGETGDTGETRA